MIAELLEAAANREGTRAFEACGWAGYYDDERTADLAAASIAEVPGPRNGLT